MTQLEIEYRDQPQFAVSFPKRQIELVVMPYETETVIKEPHRSFREIVSRGAFQGISAKRKVVVNRGHVLDNIVGRAIRFEPSRNEGLVAELYIEPTQLGEDTLRLADEGYLQAPAGFGIKDGGESWPERGLRRLSLLWLHHIAMTPNPAYPGTEVLAVRSHEEPDIELPVAAHPNLDTIYGWRLADRYALIE